MALYLLKSNNPDHWDDASKQRLIEADSEKEARLMASQELIKNESPDFWLSSGESTCVEIKYVSRKKILKTPKDELLMSLSYADLNDDEMFQEMIKQISPFLTASEMATVTGCTISTIERWLSGTAAPHKLMREVTIRRLLAEIK